ncbi:MAG: hypothetical protein IJ744_11515 [Lachnospiraceae bacterium]|nr:hypothetical protein [Lachnospiraceae bacterium]
MADKVNITPEELLSQAAEMTSLRNEYETLFQRVDTALKDTNENWSAYLARNFCGKITSVKKAEEGILTLLDYAAFSPKLSAEGFVELDEMLAANILKGAGLSTSAGSSATGSAAGSASTGEKERSGWSIAGQAGWELVGDGFSFMKDMQGFTVNLIKGDVISAASDGWRMINDVFTFGQDATALLTLGITEGLCFVLPDRADAMRAYAKESALDYVSRKGLVSEITGAGLSEDHAAVKVVETVDTASNVIGTINKAKKVMKVFKDIPGLFTGQTNIKEFIFKEVGGSTKKSGDSLTDVFSNEKGKISNIKQAYSYVDALSKGGKEFAKELWENTALGGYFKSAKKVEDWLFETITPWIAP